MAEKCATENVCIAKNLAVGISIKVKNKDEEQAAVKCFDVMG